MNDELKKKDLSKTDSKSDTPEEKNKKRSRSSPEEREVSQLLKKNSRRKNSEGTMSDSALLSKFGEMLESRMALFPTLKDFKRIEEKLDEVIKDNKNMKMEIASLKEENLEIKKNLEMLLRKSKAKSLIFKGIEESKENEDKIETVRKLCVHSLGIEEPMIEKVFAPARRQFWVVEFSRYSIVQQILSNARKLKGSGIWINKDLTYRERLVRKKLLETRKKLLEADKNERVLIRNGHLIYKGIKFFWDEVNGFTSSKQEDLQFIQNILKKNEVASASSKNY